LVSVHVHILFLSCTRPPSCPTLFPYTTLFRSVADAIDRGDKISIGQAGREPAERAQMRLRECRLVHAGLVGTDRAQRIEIGEHRSEEHTSELQSRFDLVCRLLLEKKNDKAQEN